MEETIVLVLSIFLCIITTGFIINGAMELIERIADFQKRRKKKLRKAKNKEKRKPQEDSSQWVEKGYIEVKKAIDNGADFNAKDARGHTALMQAARYGHDPKVVQLLIDNGADVHAKTNNGFTALMNAVCITDNLKVVQLLIDNFADVNAQDRDGKTALMQATLGVSPNIEILQLLINKGADINMRGEDGSTALSEYKRSRREKNPDPEIVKLLTPVAA